MTTRYLATDPTEVRLSVSAVVWRERGARHLLLMQRSDNGCWGLPGGYVEPGESVLEATRREVYEETLDTRFFPHDSLPEPFVPIHGVRVSDAVRDEPAARVR